MNMDSRDQEHVMAWRDPSSDLFARIQAGEFASERVRRWRGDLTEIRNQVSA